MNAGSTGIKRCFILLQPCFQAIRVLTAIAMPAEPLQIKWKCNKNGGSKAAIFPIRLIFSDSGCWMELRLKALQA